MATYTPAQAAVYVLTKGFAYYPILLDSGTVHLSQQLMVESCAQLELIWPAADLLSWVQQVG